jgi:hypothetical protein
MEFGKKVGSVAVSAVALTLCCFFASPEGFKNPAGPTTRQVTMQSS